MTDLCLVVMVDQVEQSEQQAQVNVAEPTPAQDQGAEQAAVAEGMP